MIGVVDVAVRRLVEVGDASTRASTAAVIASRDSSIAPSSDSSASRLCGGTRPPLAPPDPLVIDRLDHARPLRPVRPDAASARRGIRVAVSALWSDRGDNPGFCLVDDFAVEDAGASPSTRPGESPWTLTAPDRCAQTELVARAREASALPGAPTIWHRCTDRDLVSIAHSRRAEVSDRLDRYLLRAASSRRLRRPRRRVARRPRRRRRRERDVDVGWSRPDPSAFERLVERRSCAGRPRSRSRRRPPRRCRRS